MDDKNDEKLNKFLSDSRGISLTKEEKNAIRRNILLFMRDNPVIKGVDYRQSHKWFDAVFGFNFLRFAKIISVAVLIILLAGGGASFAAEGSLPGDIFYPVKIGVNEKIRGFMAFSESSKAEFQVELAERRLEEVEKLVNSGRVDSEVSAKAEANFAAHAEKVSKRIENLKNSKSLEAAAEISSNFESSLNAHEKILFVVFPHYIILRFVLFDEPGFQEQCLDFRFGFDITDFDSSINKKIVSIRGLLEVIFNSLSQIRRLSDV